MTSFETRFRVDDWWVDSVSGEVTRDGRCHRLEPRPMEVLIYLARHAGSVVSKDELMSAVWCDACVGDDSVWRSIYAVRKAFAAKGAERRVVETVPKRGYRLMATVEGLDAVPSGAEETSVDVDARAGASPEERLPDEPAAGRPSRRPGTLMAGWSTAFLLVLLVVLLAPRGDDQSRAGEPTQVLAPSSQTVAPEVASRGAPTGQDFLARGRLSYDGQMTTKAYSAVELDRAIGLFAKAIELDPTLALAHAELASARLLRGIQAGQSPWLAKAAVESAETAALLDPKLPEAHKALALIALYQGRFGEAESQLGEALAQRPAYAQARDGLADVLEARGQLAGALALRRQLLASDLPRPRLLSDLARVLMLLDQDTEARRYLNEAIALDSEAQRALLYLARLDLRAGRLEAAQRRLEEAIAAYPDATAFRDELAEVLRRQGDLAAARDVLEQSTRMPGGKFVSSWLSLVTILDRQGESERVAAMLERLEASCQDAVVMGEEHADLRLWLAAIYGLRRQTRVALSWLDEAVDRGFSDLEMLRSDPRLDTLRSETAFAELVARVAQRNELARSRD